MTRASVAVLAGIAVAGATLMAPGVVAAPTPGRAAAWGSNFDGELGDRSTKSSRVPVAVGTSGVLAGRTVTGVSGGFRFSCAVADGRAYCWGTNYAGQLGNNSTTTSNVPVAVDTSGVLAGRTVSAIAAGGNHLCALADGRAYCWGDNREGQLGNNSTTTLNVPVAVDTSGVLAGKTVTAIAAGDRHTCAVADGQMYCWGYNYAGQLGDRSSTNSTVPVAVDTSGVLTGKAVTAIAAGFLHTCAVADGRAYCWGSNDYGQLGNNSPTGSIGSPVVSRMPVAVGSGVLAGKTVTEITAGGRYSCAVADGQAYCWGRNARGQLGNSSTKKSRVPVAVNTAGALHHTSVVAIAAGQHAHTLAIAVPMTSVPSPPPATTGIKVALRKRKVKTTWQPLTAATSYRVRISKPGGKKYKKWQTISTRVFKAKVRKGKKYRFQVAAVGVGGRGPTTTKRFKAR
ncbi:MAG: hypothetical protein R2687_00175 [Candidatus Nanopelagicales bacterium]